MIHPRFSVIPAGAVTDRSLEPRDLQVLCLLGRHTDKAGWCFRSQVKMAQEIDCSRGSIYNSLARLCGAGWVQKKRRDIEGEEAGKAPSRSYAYRVVLDRDDYAFDAVVANAESETEAEPESHAENASPKHGGGANPLAGGCQPRDGTPAIPCDGTINDPLERPSSEREREARARDRQARFLIDFEKRWPSAAADDRQRTAYAAEALTEDEQAAALAGIAPFLENLKRLHRKNVPAGWRYLEEKRWTLLAQPDARPPPDKSVHPRDSAEAQALRALFVTAKASAFFHTAVARGAVVAYPIEITPRIAAMAKAPRDADWPKLTRQQAGAWDALIREVLPKIPRRPIVEGDRAPWPWPPAIDGKLYQDAPETLAGAPAEQDFGEFR